MSTGCADSELISRCLTRDPRAWRLFVDRFLPVIYRVIHHSSQVLGIPVQEEDVEDLAAEVIAALVANDLRVLRLFRGESTFTTYLVVIARRVVLELLPEARRRINGSRRQEPESPDPRQEPHDGGLENREMVLKLIGTLADTDAKLVRSYYLEHKTYRQISADLGIPRNSVGPRLARLRKQLRELAERENRAG